MFIEEFIEKIPKLELHAHLNGSLSNQTLQTLYVLKHGEAVADNQFYQASESMDLSSCFPKFKYAHDLTDTKASLKIATMCVVKDFLDDNVVYLELRTTPKANASMTKREYLETVIEAIIDCQKLYSGIIVKLLPSLDRSKGVEEAEENIAIIIELLSKHSDIIKGIDLSGDPLKGRFQDYMPVLEKATEYGLKLALHCGEAKNDDEIDMMLTFGMDRIGHGTFIDDKYLEKGQILDLQRIPFECCLTSNVKCGTVSTFDDHHFLRLFRDNYPVVVCTDDFGVFDTTLTEELKICVKTFDLTPADVIKLCENAIEHSFSDADEKQLLREKLHAFVFVAAGAVQKS